MRDFSSTGLGKLRWAAIAGASSLALFAAVEGCSDGGDAAGASGATVAATTSTTASATSSSGAGGAGGASTGTGPTSTSTGGGGGAAPGIQWMAGPSMASARDDFTATRLGDGRVLVIGGAGLNGQPLDTTEIFDPVANKWSKGPNLSAARENHTAVLLDDGTVIAIGGGNNDNNGLPSGVGVIDSTEIFDPMTNTFAMGPTLLHGRGHHRSTLLKDGRTLVAGGVALGGADVVQAEALSKDHQTWSDVGSLSHGRALFGLAQRSAGDVVVVGGLNGGSGLLKSVERFDPIANQWSDLPAMSSPRVYLAVSVLSTDGVFAAAGLAGNGVFSATTETLAADESKWSAGPKFVPMGTSVVGGSGVVLLLLESGRLLATGAYGQEVGIYGPGSYSGILDEANNAWVETSSLDTPRGLGAAVELPDHRVLLIGGVGVDNGPTATCSISAAPVK